MRIGIMGYNNRRVPAHVVDRGIAMQLTSILRDISEDFAGNRARIPVEALERFGIDERSIGGKRVGDEVMRIHSEADYE